MRQVYGSCTSAASPALSGASAGSETARSQCAYTPGSVDSNFKTPLHFYILTTQAHILVVVGQSK